MSSAAAKSQRQQLRMKATKRKTPELPSYVVEEHIDNLRAFVKLHKSKRGSPKMPAGKIRIFADCAGLSSETIALSLLGLTSEHMEFVGGSENDSAKRSMMQAVHKAFDLKTEKKLVEQDIFDRSLTETKSSDVYIAGFPCPAYSSCGRKLGAKDGQKRGLLIFEGLKYIVYRKPALVILENVSAFLNKRHARTHTQSDEEVLCSAWVQGLRQEAFYQRAWNSSKSKPLLFGCLSLRPKAESVLQVSEASEMPSPRVIFGQ